MKTKRLALKFLSTLLCLTLIICAVPITAFAADEVAIDETNFPDENFREYVRASFDKNNSGVLGIPEIDRVQVINAAGKNISSLKGIEYFTELTELNCYNNQLTSLDVSNNTQLVSLSCFRNQLTSLDVSKNTQLVSLDCSNNQLTSLDLSSNTALNYLECIDNFYCVPVSYDLRLDLSTLPGSFDVSRAGNWNGGTVSDNILTPQRGRYQVSYAYDLGNGETATFTLFLEPEEYLEINEENFPDENFREYVSTNLDANKSGMLSQAEIDYLTYLDVSDCEISSLKGIEIFTALEYLYCSGNLLTTLDLSNNTELKTLDCSYNLLTTLDVSKNTKLYSFNCSGNQLTSLDLSGNTVLESTECYDNRYNVTATSDRRFDLSTLPKGFDVSRTGNWNGATVSGNILTLDFGKYSATYSYDLGNGETEIFTLNFKIEEAIEINEENFPDENFREYVRKSFDKNNSGILGATEVDYVQEIRVSDSNISSLKGIEYFPSLKSLYCPGNQLTSLDVSKNTKLTTLTCDSNRLSSLDLSNNTEITHLYCNNNQLSSLDLSNHIKLIYLDCTSNQLTSLDLSRNIDLKSLYCASNQLSALDLGNNTKLIYLKCNSNSIPALDLSNKASLSVLYCYGNNLKALDVSNCPALTELECNGNELTSLDLSKNTMLIRLDCGSNNLTSLDLSNNTVLDYAYCSQSTYYLDVPADRSFDLTKLPGSFDVSKASEWTGGTVADNILTADADKALVTYSYDLGNGKKETFTLGIYEVVEINEAVFPDPVFRSYVSENMDNDKNGVLGGKEIEAVTELDVSAMSIKDLTGIESFSKLKALNCSDNLLAALDVSGNTSLNSLDCSGNQLTALDMSNNNSLISLDCSGNQLTELDSSKITHLFELNCSDNQLTELDLSRASRTITTVNCSDNRLTTLNPGNGQRLTTLDFHNNQITSISLYWNTALSELNCSYNQLTALYLGNNTKLTALDSSNNSYTVEISADRRFDLSTLPGGIDLSRADNWSGGTVADNILTVDEEAEAVTYEYDLGNNKKEVFTLTITKAVQPEIGDINNDGVISIDDATEIQKYIAGMTSFDETQKQLADVNGDSSIDVSDATAIQKLIAG